MWIFNQDRKHILKCNGFYIDYDRYDYYIKGRSDNGYVTLGIYDSLGKALKVLEEIFFYIKFARSDRLYYEMPLNSEVKVDD